MLNNRRVALQHQILDNRLVRRNNDIFITLVIHHVSMHHIIVFLVHNWLYNILLLLRLRILELFERLLRKYIIGLRYNGQARILQFLNRIVLHSFHLSYLFFHKLLFGLLFSQFFGPLLFFQLFLDSELLLSFFLSFFLLPSHLSLPL